jgi:hypothetical protein
MTLTQCGFMGGTRKAETLLPMTMNTACTTVVKVNGLGNLKPYWHWIGGQVVLLRIGGRRRGLTWGPEAMSPGGQHITSWQWHYPAHITPRSRGKRSAMGTAFTGKSCAVQWGQASSADHHIIIIIIIIKLSCVAWVHERTIPTERPPLVGEISANFCG